MITSCGFGAHRFSVLCRRLVLVGLLGVAVPVAVAAQQAPLSETNRIAPEQYLPPECVNYQIQTLTAAELQRNDVAAKAKRISNMMAIEMAKLSKTRCSQVEKGN